MKKFKKLTLAIGSLAAVVTPIVTVVACGDKTTDPGFFTKNGEKIVVDMGDSSNGSHGFHSIFSGIKHSDNGKMVVPTLNMKFLFKVDSSNTAGAANMPAEGYTIAIDQKSVDEINKLINDNTDNFGNYTNQAALLDIMGDLIARQTSAPDGDGANIASGLKAFLVSPHNMTVNIDAVKYTADTGDNKVGDIDVKHTAAIWHAMFRANGSKSLPTDGTTITATVGGTLKSVMWEKADNDGIGKEYLNGTKTQKDMFDAIVAKFVANTVDETALKAAVGSSVFVHGIE